MTKKKDIIIRNIDIVETFSTGQRVVKDDARIKNGDLYYDNERVAINSGGRILINGDTSLTPQADYMVEQLQHNNKETGVTVSFECFESAGLKDFSKIKVLDTEQDICKSIAKPNKRAKNYESREEAWNNFEATAPAGSTVTNDNGYYKSYHMAGSVLFQYNDNLYLSSSDEESYFTSKLSVKTSKKVEQAYHMLKPKRVRAYEKKSGKRAERQGEWFFIPCPDMVATDMRENVALPHEKGGNPHTAAFYEKASNGRHYVTGNIYHDEHRAMMFQGLHEAIENTAIQSWSVQGVD